MKCRHRSVSFGWNSPIESAQAPSEKSAGIRSRRLHTHHQLVDNPAPKSATQENPVLDAVAQPAYPAVCRNGRSATSQGCGSRCAPSLRRWVAQRQPQNACPQFEQNAAPSAIAPPHLEQYQSLLAHLTICRKTATLAAAWYFVTAQGQ